VIRQRIENCSAMGANHFRKLFQIEFEACEIPFNTGQIKTFFTCLMLLEMKNVAAMPIDEIRDGRVQALAIRALQQENCAVFQSRAPKIRGHSTRLVAGGHPGELTLWEVSPILGFRVAGWILA
jgi:hypothetical protein